MSRQDNIQRILDRFGKYLVQQSRSIPSVGMVFRRCSNKAQVVSGLIPGKAQPGKNTVSQPDGRP